MTVELAAAAEGVLFVLAEDALHILLGEERLRDLHLVVEEVLAFQVQDQLQGGILEGVGHIRLVGQAGNREEAGDLSVDDQRADDSLERGRRMGEDVAEVGWDRWPGLDRAARRGLSDQLEQPRTVVADFSRQLS